MTHSAAINQPYEPRHVDRRIWDAIEPTVLRVITEASSTQSSQERFRSHLAAFGEWAHQSGWRPGDADLLQGDRIERYIAVGMPGASESSRATRRALLRRLAHRTSPEFGDLPPPTPLPYRRVRAPYESGEVAAYLRAVEAQPTAGRRRSLTAILALGLGCGLDCRDMGWVRGIDVAATEHGVKVQVGGSRPRIVTSLRRYEALLADLALTPGEELLIGGSTLGRHNVTSTALSRMVADTSLQRLVVGRLRSTWLLTHLELRTPLPVLMKAAGMSTVRPLEDLISFAAPIDDADAWLRAC